ncbi:MAG: hypothetical protein CSA33_06900 [Desulfobulbus propionicus]|nr:MAG: hypothetical protein CSA33_06900 [Desulfobulbus propionicus]
MFAQEQARGPWLQKKFSEVHHLAWSVGTKESTRVIREHSRDIPAPIDPELNKLTILRWQASTPDFSSTQMVPGLVIFGPSFYLGIWVTKIIMKNPGDGKGWPF